MRTESMSPSAITQISGALRYDDCEARLSRGCSLESVYAMARRALREVEIDDGPIPTRRTAVATVGRVDVVSDPIQIVVAA